MTSLPLIVTMGDPSGVGPEIIARTLTDTGGQHIIVCGSLAVMQRAAALVAPELKIRPIANPEASHSESGVIEIIETGSLTQIPAYGEVSAIAGQAAYDAIVAAIGLAKANKVAGIITAPINKEALAAAGLKYPGHTEILADIGGAERVAMMLANDEIRTVLVTIHCSMLQAIKRADHAAQMSAIRLADEGTRALGISKPRVAVAGLNPHAGEGGLFGDEEQLIIAPAIAQARSEGIDASGPWPGDTVFMQARKGMFDVVVAQYHDQGLIPVKYMGLEKGVNITLGLPFIRTSPDHGTAFDIAGKAIADPTSLKTAIACAVQLKQARYKESS